jgi:cell division protein FtsB
MANPTNIKGKTARQIAAEELAAETAKKNVGRYKQLLKQIQDTKVILANYERELAELDAEVEAGL